MMSSGCEHNTSRAGNPAQRFAAHIVLLRPQQCCPNHPKKMQTAEIPSHCAASAGFSLLTTQLEPSPRQAISCGPGSPAKYLFL